MRSFGTPHSVTLEGKGTIATETAALLHIRNVFVLDNDRDMKLPPFSLETLVAKDPDIIFLTTMVMPGTATGGVSKVLDGTACLGRDACSEGRACVLPSAETVSVESRYGVSEGAFLYGGCSIWRAAMIYEKNIESMYREPVYVAGGGTRRTAWNIEWQDEPFAASDTAVVSPLKLPSLMKDIWETEFLIKELVVYIHVPFCRLSCTYCAFFKRRRMRGSSTSMQSLLPGDRCARRPAVPHAFAYSLGFLRWCGRRGSWQQRISKGSWGGSARSSH